MVNLNKMEDKVKLIIREVLEKMGFIVEVEEIQTNSSKSGDLIYNLKTDESKFLIGQFGVNLQALQHLLRVIIRKRTGEKINFLIDVNSYRSEKNESILRIAREAAQEAIQERKEIVLKPMSPYERRLIHLELSKDKDIKTESIGEGENRKVIIKPISQS